MTNLSADEWQTRAAMCELLALGFRYPDSTLTEALATGEWYDAAEEIAAALGVNWLADVTDVEMIPEEEREAYRHKLMAEATRLFIGSPDEIVSPYEGVWRAADDGVQALLFVNPHSMEVERFCKSCGLGRPEGTNEPLDHISTELELLEYLAARQAIEADSHEAVQASAEAARLAVAGRVNDSAAGAIANSVAQIIAEAQGAVNAQNSTNDAEDVETSEDADTTADEALIAASDLPGGSPASAYEQFMDEHFLTWAQKFAEKTIEETAEPFYRQAASLLIAVLPTLSQK